jgi:TPR repeat protein
LRYALALIVPLLAPMPAIPAFAQNNPTIAAHPSEQPASEAEALYASEVETDWLKAAGLFRKGADAGDPRAMYRLGTMYEEGRGLPADIDEAAKLYRSAAEGGNYDAMYRLGQMFEAGRGVNRNLETARNYLSKAAKAGVVEAMTALATFYRAEGNAAEALTWLKAAAGAGDIPATTALGHAYRDGTGVAADLQKAIGYYREASDAGDIDARLALAELYETGNGVARDTQTAIALYQELAEAGSAEALARLGALDAASGNWESAIAWYEKAAAAGSIDATLTLARAHQDGNGVQPDMAKAIGYYTQAAEAGSAQAMMALADAYGDGNGVAKDSVAAEQWRSRAVSSDDPAAAVIRGDTAYAAEDYSRALTEYLTAADAGVAHAMGVVGSFYMYGIGMESPDIQKAIEYLTRGAALGDADSMISLAALYGNGNGVAADPVRAFELVSAAAEAGSAGGYYAVGVAHEFGIGTGGDADLATALEAFRKSADLGHAEALARVARFTLNGMGGLEANKPEALALYARAAELGSDSAMLQLGLDAYYADDYATAKHWFEEAGKLGNRDALYRSGELYAYGLGVTKDDTVATKYYRRAAEWGQTDAMFSLGIAYQYGAGVEKSADEAVGWYRRAYKATGSGYYLRYAGEAYETFERYDEAMSAYREAVDLKDREAMLNIGKLYQSGRGVAKSPQMAHGWYMMASDAGLSDGHYEAGEDFYRGYGVAKDVQRGFELLWQAMITEGYAGTYRLPELAADPNNRDLCRYLQHRLKDEGVYTGAVDGSCGPKSKEAITAAGNGALAD